MTTKTRWGILGTGAAARDFAEGLRALPDAVIQAVASRQPETAAACAKTIGALEAFGSYAALARSDTVDIVYVATPHTRHHEDIRLCLDNGKPVLCEKPFVMTAAEARDVAALAREKRLFCMEAMWMRFMPLVLEAKALVQQGRIGEPLLLTADFGVPTFEDPNNRFFNPGLGGGALLDRGVYPVSLALFLLGPVKSVKAEATFAASSVDRQTAIILRHARGGLSVLHAALSTKTPTVAQVMGSAGRITLSEPFFSPEEMIIAAQPAPTRHFGASGGGSGLVKLVKGLPVVPGMLKGLKRALSQTVVRRPHRGSAYRFEAAEAMRCLNAGVIESPLMPLDDSIAVMDVLDQVRALTAERARGG